MFSGNDGDHACGVDFDGRDVRDEPETPTKDLMLHDSLALSS